MSSFYSAAKVIIENSNGEILMVQEAKDHIYKSWDFPGGGFEDEESVIECAEREALEETGYTVKIEELVGIYKEKPLKDHPETIVFVFTATIDETKPQKENLEDDILDVEFFKPEEIRELDLREQNRYKILEKYQNSETDPLDLLIDNLSLLD